MDETMDIQEARNIVETDGWDGFLNYFNERYPEHEFYSVSQSWYDDGKYICKLRGGNGDLIVGWANYCYNCGVEISHSRQACVKCE